MVCMPSMMKKVAPTSSSVAASAVVASSIGGIDAQEKQRNDVAERDDDQHHRRHERRAETDGGKAGATAAGGSRRPTAWPTRTVAAIEMPNGTMNKMEAVCSAIWCAASAIVPIQPIRIAAEANSPYSSRTAPAIGAPTRTSRRSSGQSARQKRLSTRYFLNGRSCRRPEAGDAHAEIDQSWWRRRRRVVQAAASRTRHRSAHRRAGR